MIINDCGKIDTHQITMMPSRGCLQRYIHVDAYDKACEI